MALNPGSMEPTQDRTYEGISSRPQDRSGRQQQQNGDGNGQFYMGINPLTRDSTDKAQYMGLKDARS